MKAFQLVGEHETRVMEVPVPEPGPGQVLVEVASAGLCHSDLHLIHAPRLPTCPFTFGHETAGRVAQLGAGVIGLETGEPVVVHGAWGCGQCRFCQVDLEHHCERAASLGIVSSGLGADGGLAEYLLVPAARHLVPLGDVDPRDAGPLDDAALTPYHVIKRWQHKLVPGASAVVIGAGGLGHMAIQLLRTLSSVRVVAVDTSEEKLALAKQLGADVAVRSHDGAADEIREHTQGRGAALVLDMVGAEATLALATRIVEPLSHICCVGAAMGTLPWSFISVPFDCTLSNTFWGSKGELREVVSLVAEGRIRVHAEHFALEDCARAYELLEAGKVQGRAIALPGGIAR
jgi:propanol-preferring alcohol dehydrogenase